MNLRLPHRLYLRCSKIGAVAADKEFDEELVAQVAYGHGEFIDLLESDVGYVDGDGLKEINLCRLQVRYKIELL
jgi:hypothetical protein